MPCVEFVNWVAFFELKAEEKKKAYEEAARKRGRR
jgi:hypothetical protein